MKTKVVFVKSIKLWCLLDFDGYVIFSNKRPSVVNKAKLYWSLYLTAKTDEESFVYLDKMGMLSSLEN